MHTAERTDDEFIILRDRKGEQIAIYSTRSKAHIDCLLEVVGKQVVDLLSFNVGKQINVETLEVSD